MDRLPIDQIRTPGGREEVENYRAMGISDDHMKFVRNDDGDELVLIDKDGVMQIVRQLPVEPIQCIKALKKLGVPLNMDDELEIFTRNQGKP